MIKLEKAAIFLIFLIPLLLILFINKDYFFSGKQFKTEDLLFTTLDTSKQDNGYLPTTENQKNGRWMWSRTCNSGKSGFCIPYLGFYSLELKLVFDYLQLFLLTCIVAFIPSALKEAKKTYKKYWRKQR